MQTVCVLGLGYIGLPTASVLATNGFSVLGVDTSQRVVDTVNQGAIHIEEPGLQTVVRAATQSGNLRAATAPDRADVFLIAVPTPLGPDKTADMRYVREAAASILPCLQAGSLVILESTSPPGTCSGLLAPMFAAAGFVAGTDIYLAHCPERVLPGKILRELIENDRVVGGHTPACADRARALYDAFVDGEIFVTDCTTAETVKLMENTYRDVNIALANEAALLCEQLGVAYADVARFANRHPRVHLHSPGPGVGGHCISVDPWFLVEKLPEEARLIRMARERNDAMPEHVRCEIQGMVSGIERPRVALFGLAYKGNVDDIRESPALRTAQLLDQAGLSFRIHDPLVRDAPFPLWSQDEALADADALVVLTDHAEFRQLDAASAAALMRSQNLYDTRNLFDHRAWSNAGFAVRVLGAGRRQEEEPA